MPIILQIDKDKTMSKQPCGCPKFIVHKYSSKPTDRHSEYETTDNYIINDCHACTYICKQCGHQYTHKKTHGMCIAGSCLVETPDGMRRIDTLKPGDEVWCGSKVQCGNQQYRQFHKILFIVESILDKPTTMSSFNDGWLKITDWHPIHIDGKWHFPCQAPGRTAVSYTGSVFSFVIDGASSIHVTGIDCITLAHGIKDDSVAAHNFFGTLGILDWLEKFTDGMSGHVVFSKDPSIRCKSSGRVVDWNPQYGNKK